MNSGKVPVNVLKRSVLRQLKNKRTEIADSAGLGADCAVFAPFSKGQMVTCVQEGVVELQCENDLAEAEREDLSVMPMRRIFQKCANNLAAAGAEPVAAELVIFLPETVEEPELKALMEEAEKAATDLNIQIIGGQTRVSSAVRQPIATATGYGILSEVAVTQVSAGKNLAGQDIIITKWIGLEGTADLATRNREKLLERYPAYLVEEAAAFDRYYSILPEAATAVKSGGCTMHDVSEGVISYAERSSDLVLTTISLTNVSSVIKFTVVFLGKLCVDLLRTLVQFLGQRQHTDLYRCQCRMETKHGTHISAV